MNNFQLIGIFCQIDDFCKVFSDLTNSSKLLPNNLSKAKRGPSCKLTVSEVAAILVAFHLSGFTKFKDFYNSYVCVFWQEYFPQLVSYNRFIELQVQALPILTMFGYMNSGLKTGIYYIDSTHLAVCKNQRIKRHKVFKGLAARGKVSVGWFYGFKLHLVINHMGELMVFKFTPGNFNDAKCAPNILKQLKGLAFGDKGYLSKDLADSLSEQDLKLITKIRSNMRPRVITKQQKQLLNMRGIVETVIDHLKNSLNLWHTRVRSITGGFVNLIAALVAYTIQPLCINAFKLIP
jgi:hypothetical protein